MPTIEIDVTRNGGSVDIDLIRGDDVTAGEFEKHVIVDETTPLPVRSKLSFLGAGVTAADDLAGDRTTVTIPGGGGGGAGDLLAANNLSDLASAPTARTNLGLGTLATQGGTFSGTSSGTNTGDQDLSGLVPVTRTVNGSALSSNVTISTITGNAGTATALQTARTINGTSFDGTAPIVVTAAGSTLSDTVPVAKGGTGLTAMGAALTVLRVNGAGNALEFGIIAGGDASTSFNLDQFADVTQTGTLAITGNASIEATNTGDNATNSQYSGLVSNATHTGDATGATALTLATVATAGTTGGSTAIPVITINAKGLTTSITTVAVVAPAGTLTGATLASGVTSSSLTSAAGGAFASGAFAASFNPAVPGAIGGTTPATGAFTTLNGNTITTGTGTLTLSTFTLTAAATGTVAVLGTAQTFSANQTFGTILFSGGGSVTGASGAITLAGSGTNQDITLTPSGTGRVILPAGSETKPSVAFTGDTTTGIWGAGSGTITFSSAGVAIFRATGANWRLLSSMILGWSSGAPSSGTDTGFSRTGAGVVALGTGAAGSFAGTLKLTNLILQAPASVTPASNGDVMFEFTSNTSLTVKGKGTDGVVRSVVLTLA